jgi:subfamily B ATP-binding cassette protein HlyB/CyaB
MNIIYYLLKKFLMQEKLKSFLILFLNLLSTLLEINILSYITATIIKGIELKKFELSKKFFLYFIGISVVFLFLSAITKYIQTDLLTKIIQVIREELLKIIILDNDENFSDVNFIEFFTPINRISLSCYRTFSDILLVFVPTTAFLIMVTSYFIYKNKEMGIFFLISNMFIISYLSYYWEDLLEEQNSHETQINDNEKYVLNLLNNMDKVIYRGQSINEIHIFNEKTKESIKKSIKYYNYTNFHIMILKTFINFILLSCVGYLIYLCINKKISSTIFVTFFTILILYRDKITGYVEDIPGVLEFIGRGTYMAKEFTSNVDVINEKDFKIYKPVSLNFDTIEFENVSYKYPKTDKYVFENLNLHLKTQDKIIGVTGLSGKGKSTFAKLLIKMYQPNEGAIYVDGVDIKSVDPHYIRKNITYVNQNSKLFDKVVVDNMLYGCKDLEQCQAHLNEIMKYPKIAKLYRDIDIYSKKTGSLGEKISGGQRQVVNVISGLINPTKILILDEPTNALDIELKRELLGIIKDFKKYKKCIIIISHDQDVFSLFDEKLSI